jgi:AmmeMemoRadiSam system protein B
MLENERAEIVSTKLFNSKTGSIPTVRRDLQVIPVEDDGRELLLFYDSMKLAKPGFALDRSVEPILSLIDGHKTLIELTTYFGKDVRQDEVLSFVRMLDEQLLLNSPYFRQESERIEQKFEASNVRPPALVNSSYPSDPAELSAFIDNLLDKATPEKDLNDKLTTPSKALYAPHIDLRVGAQQYAEAFSTLKTLKPERVVILATSHYSGMHPTVYDGFPYVGSSKSFTIPGRTFQPDTEFISRLADQGKEIGFTLQDRAHRIEHSIETHLLFAGHIWEHDFEIVPILVGSIDELFYKSDGDIGGKVAAFSNLMRSMDTDDTFYLISGDLSHIGKKFGDSQSAASMRSDVETFDQTFMTTASKNDPESMISHISSDYDPYRVCGFPPLYTFMRSFPDLKGQPINYHWWDEKERESAVSFGSIAY